MRKPLIAWAQLVSGLTLTALSFFQVITEIPYSTFAVLGGGFLTVDGYRNLRALRGPHEP
ncbi:hypothetical protein IAG44_42505 [Streptomyces roseirectus]|uniref:Uncharacterized protein n=2 Tax=Streptomyces roseirectus TaxID=2768066 RepID=A0A7H0IRK8_9ACTN|nr:hypothetical protein IAG44_42505 [Streptomyces roseirectus]